jgi:thiol-disulfide isomerase/thioredoxin
MKVKASAFLFIALVNTTCAQTPFKDAAKLLDAVAKIYAVDRESFRFESVTESVRQDDYLRSWQKEVHIAIKGPEGRFRLESRTDFGDWIQVSDGITEWVYFREANAYLKRRAGNNPQFPKVFFLGMDGLRSAWDTPTFLQAEVLHANGATLLSEQTIVLDGHSYPCYVVHATDVKRGFEVDETFWIEEQTLLIRKVVRQGQTTLVLPLGAKVLKPIQNTTSFMVAELKPSLQADTFAFIPPPDAKETASFEPEMHRPAGFVSARPTGESLPELSLVSSQGKQVRLSSYRGKPLVIEVWATWCAPCIESMPDFGRLANEIRTQGIEVITVDQDKTPEPPDRYLAAHEFSWTNYHDADGKLASAIGQKAIPLTILVDSEGKITYMSNDNDSAALRRAITALKDSNGF